MKQFLHKNSKLSVWLILFLLLIALPVFNVTAAELTATPHDEALTIPTPTPDGTVPGTIPPDASMTVRPGIQTDWLFTSDTSMETKMTFSPDAVEEETTFFYTELPSPSVAPLGFKFAGRSFRIDVYQGEKVMEGYVFREPILVEVEYRDEDILDLDEFQLRLYAYNTEKSRWSADGITTVTRDPERNRLTARVEHLTEFALGEAEHMVWLPLVDD